MGQVDYSIGNQHRLYVPREAITPSGSVDLAPLDIPSLDPEHMPALPEVRDRFLEVFANYQTGIDPDTGTQVGYTCVNRDQYRGEGEDLVVVYTPFDSSAVYGGMANFLAIMGASNPEKPILGIDNLSTPGASQPPPKEVMWETLRTGSWLQHAEITRRATERAGYYPTELYSRSHGSRYALGHAASAEAGQIQTIKVEDPGGSIRAPFMKRGGYAWLHIGSERKHGYRYAEASEDPLSWVNTPIREEHGAWPNQSDNQISKLRRAPKYVGRKLVKYLVEGPSYSTLFGPGHEGLNRDMEAALYQQPDSDLIWVGLGESNLGESLDDTRERLRLLSSSFPNSDILLLRLEEFTHSYPSGYQSFEAHINTAAMNGVTNPHPTRGDTSEAQI